MGRGAGEARGQRRVLDEKTLLELFASGLKDREIAEQYGISPQAVNKRRKASGERNSAALVSPEANRRFVQTTLSELETLDLCLKRARMLQDACHEWLLDPDNPEKYDVGPRGGDVQVIHLRRNPETAEVLPGKPLKRSLQELLDELDTDVKVVGAESSHADPRKLLLGTMRECRGLITDGLELAERIQSVQDMSEFRSIVLEEIGEEAPHVRARIEARVQHRQRILAAAAGFGRIGGGAGGELGAGGAGPSAAA